MQTIFLRVAGRFDLRLSKIEVNGVSAHPLYKYLTSEKPGILGTEAIKWNFTKFLVGSGKERVVLRRRGKEVAALVPIDDLQLL